MAMIQVVSFDSGLDPHEILAWRYRDPDSPGKSDELGTWAQLVVDESQEAVLYRNGQALDLFGPGRYTLSTANASDWSDSPCTRQTFRTRPASREIALASSDAQACALNPLSVLTFARTR